MFHAKTQPNTCISSGPGKGINDVIFPIFRNVGYFEFLTWPSFIILIPWSQVMLHVKFENFYGRRCLNKLFSVVDERRTTHNARRTPDALV